MRKYWLVAAVSFVAVTAATAASAQSLTSSTSKTSGYVYYGGELSHLTANEIGHFTFQVKERAIRSRGSRAGLRLFFDESRTLKFGLDVHSSSAIVPNTFGTDSRNRDISLSGLTLFLGFKSAKLPIIRISRDRFYATGVVDCDGCVMQDGRFLNYQDEFPLENESDSIVLLWDVGRIRGGEPFDTYRGTGWLWGAGYAKLKFLGVTEDIHTNFEEPSIAGVTSSGRGLVFVGRLRYGTKGFRADRLRAYADADYALSITDSGFIDKVGYQLGIVYSGWNFDVRGYVGGYWWKTFAWQLDLRIAETDLGTSVGLQVERRW